MGFGHRFSPGAVPSVCVLQPHWKALSSKRGSDENVAIVTGASRAIGKAVAERLAKDGFAVVVNWNRSKAAAPRRMARRWTPS